MTKDTDCYLVTKLPSPTFGMNERPRILMSSWSQKIIIKSYIRDGQVLPRTTDP